MSIENKPLLCFIAIFYIALVISGTCWTLKIDYNNCINAHNLLHNSNKLEPNFHTYCGAGVNFNEYSSKVGTIIFGALFFIYSVTYICCP